jgi:DNA-binding transcriptional LysR family regulator
MDLDIDLLRCFVAVAETASFTLAGDVVGRTQSAVSQRVKRLEDRVQRRLLDRRGRSLALTLDGERLLSHAKKMIGINGEALLRLAKPKPAARVRLGISDDFIPHHLPRILARFSKKHPGIDLAVQTGMSCALGEAFDRGELDLVFAKKDGEAKRGRIIWREPLAWICSSDFELRPDEPIPLVLLPPPCTYRALASETLGQAGRAWKISCTASSIMSIQAAVAGGLGVTLLGRSFGLSGLRVLGAREGFPNLPFTEVTVLGEDRASPAVTAVLTEYLTHELSGEASAFIRVAQRR